MVTVGIRSGIAALVLLFGCVSMAPEEKEARREERQYEWQEACVEFRRFERDCFAAGGVVYIDRASGTVRRSGCPRSTFEMRHAKCVDGVIF